jgi:hypothetical protein
MEYNFTKEEFDMLKAAETHFNNAVRFGIKHGSPRQLDERVKMVFERIAGPQNINLNCAQCVFTLYQRCGRLWMQDKLKYELEAKKKQEEAAKGTKEAAGANNASAPVSDTTEENKAIVEAPMTSEQPTEPAAPEDITEEEPEEDNIVIKEVDDETWNKLNQFIEEHKDYDIEAIEQPKVETVSTNSDKTENTNVKKHPGRPRKNK